MTSSSPPPKRTKKFSLGTKQKALHRAKYCCERCGTSVRGRGNPRYHHKVPYSKGGDSTLDNCEVLCVKCHDTEEGFLRSHGRRVAPRQLFFGPGTMADKRRRAAIARNIGERKIRDGLPFETILEDDAEV